MDYVTNKLQMKFFRNLNRPVTIKEVSAEYVKSMASSLLAYMPGRIKQEVEALLGINIPTKSFEKIKKGDKVIVFQNMHRLPESPEPECYTAMEIKWLLVEAA